MGQVDSQATSFAQDLQNRREVSPGKPQHERSDLNITCSCASHQELIRDECIRYAPSGFSLGYSDVSMEAKGEPGKLHKGS